jgi:hypothetical protein
MEVCSPVSWRARGRIGGVTVTAADHNVMAEPRSCVRCSRGSLLWVVGRCADCVAEMGLKDDRTEYDTWKADVQAEYGRKERASR